MYIRIKRRGKLKYAYLVKNKRYKRKKNPKQITVKYLGRLYSPEIKIKREGKVREYSEDYFKKNKTNEIIKDFIEEALRKYGFRLKGDMWEKDNCRVDLGSLKVFNEEGKGVAVEMNEGFLTEHTLKELFKYKNDARVPLLEQGQRFANLLVSAGLKMEEEVFLRLFDKIHKS